MQGNYPFLKYEIKDGVLSFADGVDYIWLCFCDRIDQTTTSVFLPNSVTGIGDGAFNGCNLTNIVIPKSVTKMTKIGEHAFQGCMGLLY